MSEKGQVRAGLGIPSMVLVLLVLCLAMLGVLSLISARNDAALAERHTELTCRYYEVATQAQVALAALDQQMTQAWQASQSDEIYEALCLDIASAGASQVEWQGTTAKLSFDAGFDRVLVVEVEREDWNHAAEKRFVVTKHVLEDVLEWEQTDGLILMGV